MSTIKNYKQQKKTKEKLPVINWYALCTPFIVAIFIVALIGFLNPEFLGTVMAMVGVQIFGGGKFTILWALKPDAGISPYQIMLIVMFIEFSEGIIYVYNVDLVRRIKFIRKALDKTRYVAKGMFRKWPLTSKLSLLTLIVFVFIPFQGTGAISGVVFSSVLGLARWKTIVGVWTGSFLGNAFLAIGVDVFKESFVQIMHNPMVTVVVIVILLLTIFSLTMIMVNIWKDLEKEGKKQKALTAVARAVNIKNFDMNKIEPRIALV